MKRAWKRSSEEDAVGWVAYTDFVTAMALVFLALVVGLVFLADGERAVVQGHVRGPEGEGLSDCGVNLGAARFARTDPGGDFAFEITGVRERLSLGLVTACLGYPQVSDSLVLNAGDTVKIVVDVGSTDDGRTVSGSQADSSLVVVILSDSLLFERNQYELKPGAVDTLTAIGRVLGRSLLPGEVLAILGHTDDTPFRQGAGKDNWTLSGERAAAAATIMTDSVGLPACRLVIIGLGASRPRIPVDPRVHSRAYLDSARAINRRIEFRRLRGIDVTGEAGHEC